jgi:two-component system cell cycle sensor histidine kinase/response regulator CckA
MNMVSKSLINTNSETMTGQRTVKSNFRLLLKLERLLSSLAIKFVGVDSTEIDGVIESVLGEIASFLTVDRCYIYLFEKNNTRLALSHQFIEQGIKGKIQQHEQVDKDDFLWLTGSILKNKLVTITSTTDLPPKANTIKVLMEVEKTQSSLLCPLAQKEKVMGIIGLDTVYEEKTFSDEVKYFLNKCSSIFAEALGRKRKAQSEVLLEQKFKNLFSRIEDVVFTSTPEGKFLEINSAGAKLFGYASVEEILKINIEQDLYLKPDGRKEFQKAINIRGHLKNFELVLKHKNGKSIIVLETATEIRNEQGEIVAYQGILHDITETRQLEQQLGQAQKLESIGLLAGGVAHDFNNILTTINGYAELMKMDLDPSNRHHKNINNIISSGKRAEKLIRNLLAFSRKQMIEPKIIDINKVIRELHGMLARLITEDIRFELRLGNDLSNVKADPIQIQQILANLVVNAGHAIKERKNKAKKGIIRIITEETILTEEFTNHHPGSREGKYVQITVEDTGSGMTEKTKQKIFEPFYSTKKESIGTGLGLSTVYGIVKQNNCYVNVESELGIGTFFEIYWPVSDKQRSADTLIESKVQFKPSGETIFLVEDDYNVRELIANALKSFGYKVFEAENGERALDQIISNNLINKIDLLISDIVMPEMGGDELAGNIKQLNPRIKILLCSGHSDSRSSVSDKYNRDGYHFLSKPFTLEKLEKTITKILP